MESGGTMKGWGGTVKSEGSLRTWGHCGPLWEVGGCYGRLGGTVGDWGALWRLRALRGLRNTLGHYASLGVLRELGGTVRGQGALWRLRAVRGLCSNVGHYASLGVLRKLGGTVGG